MPVDSHLHGILVAGIALIVEIHHVREQEGSAFLLDGIGQISQGSSYIGPGRLWTELENLPDDAEKMASALAGRNELFNPVAEEEGPDLVIVDDGGE